MRGNQLKHANNQKIVPFSNQQQTYNHSNVKAKEKSKVGIRFQWVFIFLSIFAVMAVVFPLTQSIQDNQETKQQLSEQKESLILAQNYLEDVKVEYERAQDPEYIAKVARRDYFYSKDGEIVFDLGKEVKELDQQVFQVE